MQDLSSSDQYLAPESPGELHSTPPSVEQLPASSGSDRKDVTAPPLAVPESPGEAHSTPSPAGQLPASSGLDREDVRASPPAQASQSPFYSDGISVDEQPIMPFDKAPRYTDSEPMMPSIFGPLPCCSCRKR